MPGRPVDGPEEHRTPSGLACQVLSIKRYAKSLLSGIGSIGSDERQTTYRAGHSLAMHTLTLSFKAPGVEAVYLADVAKWRWPVLVFIFCFDVCCYLFRFLAKCCLVRSDDVSHDMANILHEMGPQLLNMVLLYLFMGLLNRRSLKRGAVAARQEEILLSACIAMAICNLLISLGPTNAQDYVYVSYFLICTSTFLKIRWWVGTLVLATPTVLCNVWRAGRDLRVLPPDAMVHIVVAWAVGGLMAYVNDSARRQMFASQKLAALAHQKEILEAQARMKAQRQLAAAQAQAAQRALSVAREKAANEAKSEFMSLMCHEVRTPLNGCLASAEMLLETPLEEEQRELAKTIRVSGSILLSTVSNFLDFFKMEAGKQLDIVRTEVDLSELVADVHCIIEAMIGRSGEVRLLEPSMDGVPQFVVCDSDRVRGILLNLYTNAAKFTKSGHICLKVCEVAPDYAPVHDDGCTSVTVTPAYQPRGVGLAGSAHVAGGGSNQSSAPFAADFQLHQPFSSTPWQAAGGPATEALTLSPDQQRPLHHRDLAPEGRQLDAWGRDGQGWDLGPQPGAAGQPGTARAAVRDAYRALEDLDELAALPAEDLLVHVPATHAQGSSQPGRSSVDKRSCSSSMEALRRSSDSHTRLLEEQAQAQVQAQHERKGFSREPGISAKLLASALEYCGAPLEYAEESATFHVPEQHLALLDEDLEYTAQPSLQHRPAFNGVQDRPLERRSSSLSASPTLSRLHHTDSVDTVRQPGRRSTSGFSAAATAGGTDQVSLAAEEEAASPTKSAASPGRAHSVTAATAGLGQPLPGHERLQQHDAAGAGAAGFLDGGTLPAEPAESVSSRWLLFEVIDTGIGIAPDGFRALFKEYVQGTEDEMRKPRSRGGTGLGLSICSKQVGVLGGRIGAYSALGRGSVFWFTIPLIVSPYRQQAFYGDHDDEEVLAQDLVDAAHAVSNCDLLRTASLQHHSEPPPDRAAFTASDGSSAPVPAPGAPAVGGPSSWDPARPTSYQQEAHRTSFDLFQERGGMQSRGGSSLVIGTPAGADLDMDPSMDSNAFPEPCSTRSEALAMAALDLPANEREEEAEDIQDLVADLELRPARERLGGQHASPTVAASFKGASAARSAAAAFAAPPSTPAITPLGTWAKSVTETDNVSLVDRPTPALAAPALPRHQGARRIPLAPPSYNGSEKAAPLCLTLPGTSGRDSPSSASSTSHKSQHHAACVHVTDDRSHARQCGGAHTPSDDACQQRQHRPSCAPVPMAHQHQSHPSMTAVGRASLDVGRAAHPGVASGSGAFAGAFATGGSANNCGLSHLHNAPRLQHLVAPSFRNSFDVSRGSGYTYGGGYGGASALWGHLAQACASRNSGASVADSTEEAAPQHVNSGEWAHRALAPRLPSGAPCGGGGAPWRPDWSAIRGRRVLLVEDNLINQTVARKMLTTLGLVCQVASNGLEAVQIIERCSSCPVSPTTGGGDGGADPSAAALGSGPPPMFDVVLMDMAMPVMGGVDATRAIRKLGVSVPILAMTANASDKDRDECQAAGMDGFLAKPVLKDRLAEALTQVVLGGGSWS